MLDVLLSSLIPILIFVHLYVAPFTKVEESFNLQAAHDIIKYGLPYRNISQNLHQNYDHFSFPGAVPRTFVGAISLAVLSKPFVFFNGPQNAQLIVRGLLGSFNSFALLSYKNSLAKEYGAVTGRWFVLLIATQFHVIYYASRTLPNMFAFGLTTLALKEFIPRSLSQERMDISKRQKRGILFLVVAGVIFRAEVSILLGSQLLYLLIKARISVGTILSTLIKSASIALFTTFTVDSYLWQYLVWPELAGFYFNAIQGKSTNWGTSSTHFYFTNILPKLLLNPVTIFGLIPIGVYLPGIRDRVRGLIVPSLLYVAIYSLQPHKEARFIIYVVPPLTAAAACSASYIWNRASKSLPYFIGSISMVVSVIVSGIAVAGILFISSFNYPGGEAISSLNKLILNTESSVGSNHTQQIAIHMDVYSCMTGITRFLEIPSVEGTFKDFNIVNGSRRHVIYDKTENDTLLHQQEWWNQFDYALMETPESALGTWDIMTTVLGFSGVEVLRPGDTGSLFSNRGFESLHRIRKVTRIITHGWWIGPKLSPKIYILQRPPDAKKDINII
ncbi:dolichol-linked Man7GlcNAc2 mannosyl transferase [Blumeria hordei DH14]|uniref:Mannosyltransferase n=1 Tax=Blumeria graminis f. sp. hordei (strain DH14) TaxID=546991 RepID=N1JDZ3_BLUG1|nr:dolichol-linked Man7GlcNAc2 mannosyl transferase [Blumeria hordei DH14]